jgi:hypothetical protein
VLLFKVEVEGAVIVTPAFKIRVAAGANNPGLSARVGAVFLLGAK